MKKIIYTICSSLLLLVSCSESDEQIQNINLNPDGILVSKTIFSESPGEFYESNYFYNGNKIDKIVSNNSTEIYTYSGDLIVDITNYDNNDNSIISKRTYTYDSFGRVITSGFKYYEGDYESSENLIYNADGTITVEMKMGTLNNLYCNLGSEKLFLNELIIVKKEKYNSSNTLINTEDYYYDTKNSPFKNIIGYSKIQIPLYDRELSTNHNLVMSYLSYDYNSNDYLGKKNELNPDGTIFSTTEYFY